MQTTSTLPTTTIPKLEAQILAFWLAPNDAYLPEEITGAALSYEAATLAQMRSRGTGPVYLKVRQNVFYRKSDIVDWMTTEGVSGINTGEVQMLRDSRQRKAA